MGIFADLKLLMDFRKQEKASSAGKVTTPSNPLVSMVGYERTYGRPSPHDQNNFVENFQSWAFVCGYKNGFSIAKTDLRLYKEIIKEGGIKDKEEITEHVFLDLMKNINPHFNKFELFTLTSIFMEVTGNAYWWIVKDNLGVPRAIWNLPANWVKIVPSKSEFIAGYLMTVPGNKGIAIPFEPGEIVHFKFPSIYSLYYGCPPMFGATYDIDLNKHIKTYGINFMMNNAQPAGVLETEDSLTEPQFKRLITMWKMRHQGSTNAGKIAILEKGLKYNQTGSTLADMKFEDVQRGVRDGILAAFGVPASKLGLVEDVNRANADANDYTYQKETILPRLTLIQEKLNEKMIPMYDEGLVCEFDNPVPEDKIFRLQEQREHIQSGYASIDEEREKDGQEPYKFPETVVPLLPFNVVPAGSGGLDPSSDEDASENDFEDEDMEKSFKSNEQKARRRRKWEVFAAITGPQERFFENAMRRFFVVQHKEIKRNINKYRSISKDTKDGFEANLIFTLEGENNRLKDIAKPHISESYKSGVELGYKELEAAFDFALLSPNILRSVDRRISFFADKVNRSTLTLLNETIQQGVSAGEAVDKIADRIDEVMVYSERYRSVRVARTEVIGAANDGQLAAYIDNGIEDKMWITARDERVRSSHQIEGQVVGITENFTLNSGVKLQAPGDRKGEVPAGEVVNCRCTVSPIVKKGE